MTATLTLVPTAAPAAEAPARREYALRWCFGCVTPARRRSRMLARLRAAGLWQLCPTCTSAVIADARAHWHTPTEPGWIDPDEVRALLDPTTGRPVNRWLDAMIGAAA